MFRLASLLALVGVLTSPVVGREQMVCRYTGQVIVGCDQARVPAVAQFQTDCCDRQLTTATGPASAAERQRVELPGAIALLTLPPLARTIELPPRRLDSGTTPSIGPPIFIRERALLI